MREVASKPFLNQVAIWSPITSDTLNVRKYESYLYMESMIVREASPLAPIYRYCKTYTLKKAKYSLLLITRDKNAKKVEKFLDSVSEDVKSIPKKFKYLEARYNG